MRALKLPSLRIQGYRGFSDLVIPQLGRVNLLTGKNNAGKSSVLEALRLYGHRGSMRVIHDILKSRDEAAERPDADALTESSWRHLGYQNLFHGRSHGLERAPRIGVGPNDASEGGLSISFTWYVEDIDEESRRMRRVPVANYESDREAEFHPALSVSMGERSRIVPLDDDPVSWRQRFLPESDRPGPYPCHYLSADGIDSTHVARLWDAVSLTPHEEQVLDALRIVSPEIEKLSLKAKRQAPESRAVFAKLQGLDEPIPLKSLGDGINRILGISLGLVNSTDGLLLLDEVENGIHYSVQSDLWRLIFRTARQQNVQVFATTHSYDCVEAFQEAACETEDEEGVLVRVERRHGQLGVTTFDEKELAIVTRHDIEVR